MDPHQIVEFAVAAQDMSEACGSQTDSILDLLAGSIISEEDAGRIREYITNNF